MSVYTSADYGNLENNENLSVNVKWHINNQKNDSGSQEIFSDDDQAANISCNSSRVSIKNNTFNSSLLSIKTPTICTSANEENPGRAKVPRTPADLLPFIKKTSFLWTSDMETPQSKIDDQSIICDKSFNSTNNLDKTPIRPKTPPQQNMEINPKEITSPVLGGKKRSKRKVKRRILNINLELDYNNDRQSSTSSDKATSQPTSSASSDAAFDIQKEVDNWAIKESNNLNNLDCKENKLLEEVVNVDKNSNTSTQDFFSNASFSSIDKLCSTAIKEETIKPEPNSNQYNLENNISKNVSNDVLERVASIRKNQKQIRRSMDISHTVIPKEVFSKSVIDLELADTKFSQEKKPVSNKPQSLPLMSFSKLSSLDNFGGESSCVGKSDVNFVTKNVPVEAVNSKNINSAEQSKKDYIAANNKVNEDSKKVSNSINSVKTEPCEKIYSDRKCSARNDRFSNQNVRRTFNVQTIAARIENNMLNSENKSHQSTDGFLTGKGKSIPINQDKLLCYEKVYQDIEKEIPAEDLSLDLKRKKEQPKKLSTNFEKQTIKRTDMLKIQQDLKLKEFLEPKFSTENGDAVTDGFSTARGGEISISKEKESLYLKIYSELSDDVDMSAAKTSNTVKSTVYPINQSSKSMLSSKKAQPSSTVTSSDGFSTARGGGIRISKEKENLYLKLYNELSDDTDFSAVKKSNIVKQPVINQAVQSSISKKTEFVSCKASTNVFETARGSEISISNEKEKQYLKIYSEFNDIDEDSLLNIKTNKQFKLGNGGKPTDKVVLTMNKKSMAKPNARDLGISTAKVSNDGFSTGKGIDIPISSDKESYYLKIYNELSDDIPGESSKNKSHEKPFTAPKPIKIEPITVKKEKVDEVFEEIGDLAEFFSPPHESNTPEDFVVPNSSNIIKKAYQPLSAVIIPQVSIKKEVSDEEIFANANAIAKTTSSMENRPVKNAIGLLKRKLDDCDAKRTGRCRSFGGFPADGEGLNAVKLNKSDPHNESSIVDNQPLQKGLSISQCFDAHSDSWLSKVEISYLNGSKVNSPKVRKQSIEHVTVASASNLNVSKDCPGFSSQEIVESLRLSSNFKSFLKKQRKKCDNGISLALDAGQKITVTITNQTSSKRELLLKYENSVEVKKSTNEFNYVLVEPPPKIIEIRKTDNNIAAIEKGKRKHVDTDSDTPLTSVKKPRVGSELQGRRLFSDESDGEEMGGTASGGSTQPVQSMEIQELEVEAEEEDVDLSEERMSAILQQEKVIRNKKRMKIKPAVGRLLSERLANSKSRTSWSQLVGSSVPMPLSVEKVKQNHPDAKVLDVTASNATCYTFLASSVTGKKNVVSLDVGDGAVLVFDKDGQAGASEFSQAFLAMPGVDPKLLPGGWVENHYKWIVWKLAALDRMQFGSTELSKNLTPQRVMSELKYRYDREIDKAQRPALRKILEKDDVSTRRMVLCISSIKECVVAEETEKEARTKLGLPQWKVEATDGWYDIPLTMDSAMANYISTGKIKEGTKIITYGAELMECERGFFPLEKPPNVSLKIHTNCTRRAKWDTKLGYQKISRPLPVKLRDIISAGGMIGEITAAAARIYPVLYREKTADGKSIYRNARCEEKAAIAHERAVEKKVDAMYAEAQKNFDSKKKSESDEDFDTSQSQKLNHYERKQEAFKRKLESQVRQGLPPRRDVTTVLKVRLVDDGTTTVILSIWGAGEESDCDIREGDTVSVYNCFAAGHRGGDLNLTANRMTHIKTEPLLKLPYPNRMCTLIPDIGTVGFEPKFGEFDTVGIVVSSGSAPYGMKNFEMVNIAYPKPDGGGGSSYLSVLFWNGIASFGYQGMFTPGSLVACSNLEWRRNLWSIAVAYCTEKTVFTGNPRQVHLIKEIRNLKALVQNPVSYAESCVDEVAAELTKKPQPRSTQGTPTSWPTDRSSSFASPADHCSPGNVTLQKRLDKLSRYGTSPEISPIVLNSSSNRINKDFTPVARRKT